MRVVLGVASLGLALTAAGFLVPEPALAASTTRAIAVDRQDYVADNGAPDAYEVVAASEGGVGSAGQLEPDPLNTHVATAPNAETYHSFVHVALPHIPAGDTVTALTVRMVPTSDPNRSAVANVNTGAAVVDAWPLKTELPMKFDPSNPPQPDTTGHAVVGRLNADGSWTFDFTRYAAAWEHADNGAAIVADAGAAMQPWSIGFDDTLTTASITYAPVDAAAPVTGSGGGALDSSAGSINPSTGAGPAAQAPIAGRPLTPSTSQAPSSPPAAPVGAASPAPAGGGAVTPAGGGSAAPSVAPAAAQPGSGVPVWLVVLLLSGVAAVGLLAQPVTQALASTAGLRAGLLGQWKVHPRLIVVAGGLVAWSSAFSVYAATTGKASTSGPAAVAQAGTSTQSATSSASSTDTGAGGSAATPGATAAASAGATPGAVTAGNGANAAAAGGATRTTGGGATHTAPPATAQPAGPNPPAADLYSGADDTKGITADRIQLCAHAALTFGPAFNIGASDLNVFWQMIDEQGGVYGRKVVDQSGAPGIEYQDDGYQTSKAVQAAQKCMDDGTFFLLGGIGFDQIPGVRIWAEQNHMIYIHHIATEQGTAGLQYSYTMLPTLEQVGTSYGQYYLAHLSGEKIGIIYRNSSNWDPGRATFKQTLASAGKAGNICDEEPVNNNQGDYTTQIVKLSQKGCTAVFIWENALAAEQIIQQSSNQSYNPKWLMFPFNLTLQTLNQAGVDTSQMQGIVPWPAYTCNSANRSEFSPYKQEILAFEAAYRKYDPNANLCGVGGDLLFGTWLGWKQVYDLLVQCGPSCTRNKIAGVLQNGYHARVGANCTVDFRNGDGHHGGTDEEDVYNIEKINGTDVWYTTQMCVTTVR